ncbi:MAG: HlyD family secretion protein [Alphaproteobacteria bacterium]|nr:HlyD family secretion protein [Alphaproteobacteria bacterium]
MSNNENEQSGEAPAAETNTPPPVPMRPRRRWGRMILRLILLIVIPAAAIIAGGYWYEATGRYVTTENAYVKAHVIAVSPNIDGRVTDVYVGENQRVRAGETLFKINAEPFWMMVRMSEAKRETARQEIEATRAEYHQIVAEIEKAKADVKHYEREAGRQRKLASKAITTRTRLDDAEFNLSTAKQDVATRRQKIRTVLARLGGDPARGAELHPDFIAAETEKAMAEMNLGYTEIKAPVDGIITRLKLEAGEWVEEGEPAFGLIAVDKTWIEANLKETQLTHVRVGQDVKVEIDAYPDAVWKAKIASISPATGAEFSVLPPQNASGNWVKVVQRLPVRIEIETAPEHPPLRAGMTATVTVDTHHKRELWSTVKSAIAGFQGDDEK